MLPFRHIHLDFHTSEHIDGIGVAWDAEHWIRVLREAAVESVNIFATCHHGWSYYDSTLVPRHPHLGFDLCRAQHDACRRAGIRSVIYMTVGVNNRVADEHPEWRCIAEGGWLHGWATKTTAPGFHDLCFNTPYLDLVCAQVRELARAFPDADGLWLDIIHRPECCCRWCLRSMVALGLDPTVTADRRRHAVRVQETYYRRVMAALREAHPTMRLFQNSGHVERGNRAFLGHVTHLELESLPTWGWGYDHFPMSAAYARTLGAPFLGMTGKFHTHWGEFGGFKSANALRYECAAMLAHGARCGIGDQMHPCGRLDESTYRLIGEAYREVAAKEPWCVGTAHVADVAVLSTTALDPGHPREDEADTGACRLLFEAHLLFDLVDGEADLAPYRLVVVPDDARIDERQRARLQAYVDGGGRLLLSGASGLDAELRPLFDIGGEIVGRSAFEHHYIRPAPALRPPLVDAPIFVYDRSFDLRPVDGESLGEVHELYFNRTWQHFCSHMHAPARSEANGFACGVRKGRITYLAFPLFTVYRRWGAVAHREFAHRVLRSALGQATLTTDLPTTARVTLTRQAAQRRWVAHLLYAPLVTRGAPHQTHGVGANATHAVEVIDDLPPLHDVTVAVRLPAAIARATLEPQGIAVPLRRIDGGVELRIDRFACHQMVALHEA